MRPNLSWRAGLATLFPTILLDANQWTVPLSLNFDKLDQWKIEIIVSLLYLATASKCRLFGKLIEISGRSRFPDVSGFSSAWFQRTVYASMCLNARQTEPIQWRYEIDIITTPRCMKLAIIFRRERSDRPYRTFASYPVRQGTKGQQFAVRQWQCSSASGI